MEKQGFGPILPKGMSPFAESTVLSLAQAYERETE